MFVDGVTESLTTDLSRINNAVVVSRNTASTYKGKSVDAKQIGRDLNVRYILEGSIQRGANRMRINVQLIDAITGNHLWADRFDKPMGDLFDMQDEIVSHLANQLRPELLAAEAKRAETVADPDSVDLYFQGIQWFSKGGPDNIERARGYFERAVALDPTNVDALVGAARADVLVGAIYTTEHRAERLAEAEKLLIKGISIAPRNYWAHMWLASSRSKPIALRARSANWSRRCRSTGTLARRMPGWAKRKSRWAALKRPRLTWTRRFGCRRMTRSPSCGPTSGASPSSTSAPMRKRSRSFAAPSTPAEIILSTISTWRPRSEFRPTR